MSQRDHLPELLYVCAVIPALTGNGLAMRAGMILEALSEFYRISLISIPRTLQAEENIPNKLLACCERIVIVSSAGNLEETVEKAGTVLEAHAFDTIHVFRLAAFSFARPYFQRLCGRARLHLDLDDIESKTHRRIAGICEIAEDAERANFEKAWARNSALFEGAALRIFHRVYVCSEADRQELLGRTTTDIRVLRNAVRLPPSVSAPARKDPFRYLFVGTLGYFPNQDAVRYFCKEILPILRERTERPFRVDFVGDAAPDDLLQLTSEEVCVTGRVPSPEPWYRSCDAVIVPLRAGGGTRIKILEAFSYRRPVVTTSLGIEGIEAEPDRHALIADSPDRFATACIRLMADPKLASELVENGYELFRQRYSLEALKRDLRVFD